MLAFGCCLLLWGRLADLYGRRKLFILGTAWVTATTAANPFMPNEIAFDLLRGLQGLVSDPSPCDSAAACGLTMPRARAYIGGRRQRADGHGHHWRDLPCR